MVYFLSKRGESEKLVIDTKPHGTILGDCDVDCWLQAKKELGFDLTPVQEILLAKWQETQFAEAA